MDERSLGARGIGDQLQLLAYADNGRQPSENGVRVSRKAATDDGATLIEIGPGRTDIPLSTTDDVTVSAVVPNEWPTNCEQHPNHCSIGLLVECCDSGAKPAAQSFSLREVRDTLVTNEVGIVGAVRARALRGWSLARTSDGR